MKKKGKYLKVFLLNFKNRKFIFFLEFSEYEIDLKDIPNNNHSTTQTQQSQQHIHIGHRKRNPLTKIKSKLDKVETTRRRKQQKWNDNQNVKL
ncbi:unnamed protein product [Meloidogyne enterolobii]|uniref:Uncharacterized protein n=1 Tax=Meloidogyne enterolobii TaxID=390850 RepID=A0ACB0YQP4_MELEN